MNAVWVLVVAAVQATAWPCSRAALRALTWMPQKFAATVTGVDVMAPTAPFSAELERRGSKVRFVQGDLHEPAIVERIGRHDVVWCSGVLYHAPHPLLTLSGFAVVEEHRTPFHVTVVAR